MWRCGLCCHRGDDGYMAHYKFATVVRREMVAQLHFPAALSAAQMHTSASKAAG